MAGRRVLVPSMRVRPLLPDPMRNWCSWEHKRVPLFSHRFEPGIPLQCLSEEVMLMVKSVLVAFILISAFACRLIRHRKKWGTKKITQV